MSPFDWLVWGVVILSAVLLCGVWSLSPQAPPPASPPSAGWPATPGLPRPVPLAYPGRSSSPVSTAPLAQSAVHASKSPGSFDSRSVLPFPKEERVSLPDIDRAKGWLHLKASVKGFEKEELQDAHAVRVKGDVVILVVADGQSRKARSKAAADLSVKVVADALVKRADDPDLSAANWPALAKAAFMEAKSALEGAAQTQNAALTEFACTLIAVMATGQEVHCAHVGDGRAGYLGADNVFRPILEPYKEKDGEANATVFLTMLTQETVDAFLRSRSETVRTRCVVALSDGPESYCWHVSTQDKDGKGFADPNLPAGTFFAKIARQLAEAEAKAVGQEDLDKLWADFLASVHPGLSREQDDKTLLLALRG